MTEADLTPTGSDEEEETPKSVEEEKISAKTSEEVEKKRNLFNPAEVEWISDMIPQTKNKIMKKIMIYQMKRLRKYINYLQKPLFKIINFFGKRILQFFGLEPLDYEVVRLKEYLVTSFDGAKLATDVYLPKPVFKEKYKAPTILIRLPYWKDSVSILGYFFASMGYCTVLQDTRGCAHSKPYGTNSFLIYEGPDGLTTLSWITKRFWYNGKIGMWGMSYFGITQLAILAALSEEHKGLVTCLNPGMASFHSVLYHPRGLLPIGMGASIYNIFRGVTANYEINLPSDIFDDEKKIPDRMVKYPLLNLYNEKIGEPSWTLHFNDLAKVEDPRKIFTVLNEKLGLKLKINEGDTGEFEKLLKLTAYDRTLNPQSLLFPFGLRFNFQPTVPMLYLGGHYDMFQEEFWRDLKVMQAKAPEYCKKNFKIVIGPWAHGGMDQAFNDRGSMALFQKISLKDTVDLARKFMPMNWFNFFLKRGKTNISKIPPIQVFILNKKIWRNFKSWPPRTREMKLYLHSEGSANSRFGNGVLSTKKPVDEPADKYDFDPANPVITQGGRFLFQVSGPHNQLNVEKRTDILVYTTDKLDEGIEIIGEVRLKFYASSSAKDTDFMAKLVDVSSSGRKAINILDDGVRARFRESIDEPTLLKPDNVYEYEINLGTIAVYFPKGHRIRLELTSSNYPKYDINANLGGDENEQGYIIAQQKIFHNSQHPSHLILPLFMEF